MNKISDHFPKFHGNVQHAKGHFPCLQAPGQNSSTSTCLLKASCMSHCMQLTSFTTIYTIPMSPLHDSNVTAKGNSIHIYNLFYCHITFSMSFTLGAISMSFSLNAIINLFLFGYDHLNLFQCYLLSVTVHQCV